MTTECLPCEQMATQRNDIQNSVPDIDPDQTAEWSGPIGIESQRTGDGRLIETNALRWDTLPVPLRWAMQDFGAHDGAYVVGKIEQIERLSYEEANERLLESDRDALPESFADVVILWGSGVHDLGSEYGREAHRQVKEGLTPGISMDLDDIVVKEDDEDSFTILEGRVRAATQVAIPAFEGARIAVSGGKREVFDATERLADADTLMGDDVEAFNWVDDVGGLPQYIKRISKHLEKKGMTESHAIATAVNVVKKMCATGDVNFPGAQQVNAGSRAEACAAVASWEEKKARAKASSAKVLPFTGDSLVAGATVFNHEWFQDPHLDGPTGLTVTDDGHVFGHIAIWGTCHIANPQGHRVCTQPPRSYSNYAYFRQGAVSTTAGEVPVGKITMNTLHAGAKLSSNDTVYHYEHTGSVGAYVTAGEDQYGIWVSGAANPKADLTALKAAPVSGDWRTIGGNLELVGALSVNVPGFPVPRAQALVASGQVQSLVASGVFEADKKTEDVMNLDDNALRTLRTRFNELDRRDKALALKTKVDRLAALEKVRRVHKSVFAYNPNQWRVPKGNGKLSGRFVDMPDGLLADLETALIAALETATGDENLIEEKADQVGIALEKAATAADRATAALKNGDGPGATAAASEVDEHLSQVEATLGDMADSGMFGDDDAATAGDALDTAREGIETLMDADLSLLGEEMIGEGDGGDIGGDKNVPDATDIGADVPAPAAAPAPSKPRPGAEAEGGTPVEFGDLPTHIQEALGNDNEAETFHESTRWPGTTEVRMTDDNGVEQVVAVADSEGNVVGDISGPSEDFVIYSKDGDLIGDSGYKDLNDAVADLPGYDPDMVGEDPVDPGDAIAEMSDAELLAAIKNGTATPAMMEEANLRGLEVPGEAPAAESPGGSVQQRASSKAVDTGIELENDLIALVDQGIMDDDRADDIGTSLQDLQDALAALDDGIQDGNYNAADLAKAQNALSGLEAKLMDAAEGPGMSDDQANDLGQALDNMFEDLNSLAESLKGNTEVPFSVRSYSRQWLGRRGIRLGSFSLI